MKIEIVVEEIVLFKYLTSLTSGEISLGAWQLLFIFSSTVAIKTSTIEPHEIIIYKTIYVSITLQILWDNCKSFGDDKKLLRQ